MTVSTFRIGVGVLLYKGMNIMALSVKDYIVVSIVQLACPILKLKNTSDG